MVIKWSQDDCWVLNFVYNICGDILNRPMVTAVDVFCISLDLDKFLTLKNANIFVFFSLTRNFALTLYPKFNK